MSETEIIAIVEFVAGAALLSWCSTKEKRELAAMRDPKVKWSYIDGDRSDDRKRRSLRGTILTVIGGGVALHGLFTFLSEVTK